MSPTLACIIGIIMFVIGMAFVLPAQGYPTSLRVKPLVSFWASILCLIAALSFFIVAVTQFFPD